MGGKSRKKKADKKTPLSLKESGNQAFVSGDYTRALALYTESLAMDPSNAVVLCNRAALYIEEHRYGEAVDDLVACLELDPNYVKAYYRLGIAFRETSAFGPGLEKVRQGLALDPENEALTDLERELDGEFATRQSNPTNEEEDETFRSLITWLTSDTEGDVSDHTRLEMIYYSEGYRGVHSSTFIRKGETLLYIPLKFIMTLEDAKATKIGKQLEASRLRMISPKHSFISQLLLREKHKGSESFYKPYIDILPATCPSFPVFYSPEDRSWLEGSPFLEQIMEKIEDIKKDYDAICDVAPDMAQYTIEEYTWARMTICSRIFGIEIGDIKTDGLVPYADMLNHRRPRQTDWSYSNKRRGFIIEALEDIPRGATVMDSYGKKCNSRFLLNYGFYLENNDANEYPFNFVLDEKDPHVGAKRNLIEPYDDKSLRVMAEHKNKNLIEALGWMRFIKLQDMSVIPQLIANWAQDNENSSSSLDPGKIGPISIENEKRVLQRLKRMSVEGLSKYPTTYEEDMQILQNPDLTFNNKNCVLMRSGEKAILLWFIEFVDTCTPMFDMPSKELRKLHQKKLAKGPYDLYISNVILPLIRQANN